MCKIRMQELSCPIHFIEHCSLIFIGFLKCLVVLYFRLLSVVAMPRETGFSGPLIHHMIHHLCMAYSHLERMMNLTPAHIRNHYFSREDMSHLRVPRSDPANNQVLGEYIFDLSEPPRWEPSPSNSPSPSPAHEEPAPPCAAAEFFDYHDDLPSFTTHGHSPPSDEPGDHDQEDTSQARRRLLPAFPKTITSRKPKTVYSRTSRERPRGHRDPPPEHVYNLGTEAPATPPFVPPRSWSPADDQLLRSYKEDAKKRPSWKTVAKILRRSEDECKIRWNLIRTSPAGIPPDSPPPLPPEESPMDDGHDHKERSPKRRKS